MATNHMSSPQQNITEASIFSTKYVEFYILVDNLMTPAWLNYQNQKLRR